MTQGISEKIVRNSTTNALRGGLSFVLVLFLTPFIISRLGATGFGIWALTNALVSYVGLIDLGIGSALVKFVAEYQAKGDDAQINVLLNTAFAIYAILGTLAFGLLAAQRGWMIHTFFHIGSGLQGDVEFVFLGSLVIFVINLAFGVFAGLLNGLQRMDLTNLTAAIAAVINAVGVVMALNLGYGLRGLVIVSAIVALVSIAINAVMAKREFKALVFNPFCFRLSYVKNLLNFGLQLQVVGLASLVHAQLDKIVLGYFLGLNPVMYYEAATRVIERLRALPMILLSPIMPAASELHAGQESETLHKLYHRSLKYVTLTSLPVFVFVAIFAHPLVSLWLGPGYEMTAFALQFLAMANFVNLLTGPGFLVLVGMGKPKYGTYFSLLALLTNAVLSVALVSRSGYAGAVLGPTISMTLWGGGFIAFSSRILRQDGKALFRTLWGPLWISLLLSVVLYAGLSWFDQVSGPLIGSFVTAYFSVYILALWKLGIIDTTDKHALLLVFQPHRKEL